MEGLKTRTIAFAGVLILGGVVNQFFSSVKPSAAKTEAWLEQTAPQTLAGFSMHRSADNPAVSYRMDKVTYETLHPYGIVARIFSGQEGTVDVVIIASQAKDSFHDPRNCFTSQGYNLDQQNTVIVPTKTRGDIPFTLVNLTGKQKSLALFGYRGPGGFFPSTIGLKLDMLKHQLLHSSAADGIFYRFIAQGETTKDQLIAFVGKYMDEANSATGGYM